VVNRNRKGQTVLKGLGTKFGATVRKRYSKVYRTLKQKRRCPSCGSLKFMRIACEFGIVQNVILKWLLEHMI
jgi:ribosomal protein L37AE/L43A